MSVSETSKSVYHSEIKGKRENRDAVRVYDYLKENPRQESKQIAEELGMPRTNVTRALNFLFNGGIEFLYVDYEVRDDRKGRAVKHFFVTTEARKPQTIEDVLKEWGFEINGAVWYGPRQSFAMRDMNGWSVGGSYFPNLTPRNLPVILEAMGAKK